MPGVTATPPQKNESSTMNKAMLDPRRLFKDNRNRLRISWLGGRESKAGEIMGENLQLLKWGENSDSPTCHHLYIMNSAQWTLLDHQRQADLCTQASTTRPFALLFADTIELSSDLVQIFDQAGIPLFTSSLPAERIFNELIFYKRSLLGESQIQHGVFIEVHGVGTLLTGESGVGKSELALALVSRGHRLIADDAPEFWRSGDIVSGACPPLLQDFIEVRGLGFLDVRALFGDSSIKLRKNLQLIIQLKRMQPETLKEIDRSTHSYAQEEILGVQIPHITLPVTAGGQLAILTETAVRVHIQRRQGHDSNRSFSDQQQSILSE